MLPPESTLAKFAARHPLGTLGLQQQQSRPEEHAQAAPKRREPFPAWSAIDETKKMTGKIEPWTLKYYAACTVGGLLACVSADIYTQQSSLWLLTAAGPYPYSGDSSGSDQMPTSGRPKALQEQHASVPHDPRCRGPPGCFHGLGTDVLWLQRERCHFCQHRTEANTHSKAQGAFKYGGYEFFKKFYGDLVGQERANKWKTSLYLTASASAELIADVALCPFESVKVRMQTTIPPTLSGTFSGISSVVSQEGVSG